MVVVRFLIAISDPINVSDTLLRHCATLDALTNAVRHLLPSDAGDEISSALADLHLFVDEYIPDDLTVDPL